MLKRQRQKTDNTSGSKTVKAEDEQRNAANQSSNIFFHASNT